MTLPLSTCYPLYHYIWLQTVPDFKFHWTWNCKRYWLWHSGSFILKLGVHAVMFLQVFDGILQQWQISEPWSNWQSRLNNANDFSAYIPRFVTILHHWLIYNFFSLLCPRIVMSVCLCVCPRPYLWNHTSGLVHVMAVSRFFFSGIVIGYIFVVLWMTSYLQISWSCLMSPPGWGSEAHTQAWAWHIGIPVAGSGRLALLLAVRAY